MKNGIIVLAWLCLSLPSLGFENLNFVDKAKFEKQWIDYGVTEAGQLGMRIHLRFQTIGLKDSSANIAIYFEYDDERGRLKDNNQKFYSTSGEVAIYKEIKPKYDPAMFEDFQLFMPYEELDLYPGKYFLKMDVDLIRLKGGLIQHLNFFKFDYEKPRVDAGEGGKPVNTQPTANFNNLWNDYDVTQENQRGMVIHVNFTAYNLKEKDCYLALSFETKAGDAILTNNMKMRSKNGQLTMYTLLRPGYDVAEYKDQKAFLPYSEFNLGKGSFELRVVATVMYKDGTIIKRLGDKEFRFTQ